MSKSKRVSRQVVLAALRRVEKVMEKAQQLAVHCDAMTYGSDAWTRIGDAVDAVFHARMAVEYHTPEDA